MPFPGTGPNSIAPQRLSIPDLPADCDMIKAAIAYAVEGGFHVGPLRKGSKDPGSVLGKGWPSKTSRDPQVIAAWFAGTDCDLFLHLGRSGAVALDVDHWEALPAVVREEIARANPPFQSTRTLQPGRGHYLFAVPPGRVLGNSTGKLGKGWGEVRGANGVIVVEPSTHGAGGRYEWVSTGPLPVLGDTVADLLPDAAPGQDAVTDEALSAARGQYLGNDRPGLMSVPLDTFTSQVEGGASRHESAVIAACWIARDAVAQLYPLGEGLDALRGRFVAAMVVGTGGGRSLSQRAAQSEFDGVSAWAVGQVSGLSEEEIAERRARVTPKRFDTLGKPSAQVVPAQVETEAPGAVVDAVVDWREFWAMPDDDEWILEPLIPARRLVALYSAPKVGKSLLMLELALGIARGTEVLGVVPTPRRVLYVDFENDLRGDVRSRLRAMGHGPDTDLENLRFLSMPSVLFLDTPEGGARLVAVAEREGTELVIIDTVSRAVAGAENDNDTWLDFYRHTGMVLKAKGIALIRLDHSGKDEGRGQRGGSAKVGDVDALWHMTKVTDDTFRLTLDAARLRITEPEIVLTRLADPLRYKVEGAGWMAASDAAQREAWAYLDALGAPADMGRVLARQALKESRIKISNAALDRMLALRQKPGSTCPGQVSGA